jgi:GT2 family glycosyltransferase
MWAKYRDDQANSTYQNFEEHFAKVRAELAVAEQCPADVSKDIIVVVRNQLTYLKQCVESVQEHTENYHLYIWDNGSGPETVEYIQNLQKRYPDVVSTMMYSENVGFIRPNNELAGWGDGEYIILLNSDCKVFHYWDRAMIGFLRATPDVAQVGFWGGHMDAEGRGFGGDYGYNVDYIPGWCFCISRATYRQYGLFSHELQFAYCEDADLSLRLKEAGHKIYALHPALVHHYQNKTIKEVEKEGQVDVRATFEHNHQWMRKRWADYIETKRVLLTSPEAPLRS